MSKRIAQYIISHCKLENDFIKDREILYLSEKIQKDTSNGIVTWKGDNIDHLNKYYCEMTAIYWVWKNIHNVDYVSIEHYRRVFLKNKFNIFFYEFLDKKTIEKIFCKYDIILPRKHHFKKNIYQHYDDNHYIDDINLVREIVSKKYKDYLKTFDLYFSQNDSTLFNMCIMSKKSFDEYCEFAFSILDDVYKGIKENIILRDSYQQRAIGFLAERLFNVWIRYNYDDKKIYYCSVGHLNQNCFIHNIKNCIFKIICREFDI